MHPSINPQLEITQLENTQLEITEGISRNYGVFFGKSAENYHNNPILKMTAKVCRITSIFLLVPKHNFLNVLWTQDFTPLLSTKHKMLSLRTCPTFWAQNSNLSFWKDSPNHALKHCIGHRGQIFSPQGDISPQIWTKNFPKIGPFCGLRGNPL